VLAARTSICRRSDEPATVRSANWLSFERFDCVQRSRDELPTILVLVLENFRLKVFRAVAQHLSFRKAAEALYLTQPAVTLQVKTLEEEVGLKLFERSSTGVSLTEAGRLLLQDAEQLHQFTIQAENRLAALKGQAAGELSLGASTTIAQYILPALLAEFSSSNGLFSCAESLTEVSFSALRVSCGSCAGAASPPKAAVARTVGLTPRKFLLENPSVLGS
jgi:DNA-binding transcriptional LysR family regulator